LRPGDDDNALLVVTIGCDDVVRRNLDTVIVVVVGLIEQCQEYDSNGVYLMNDDVYVPW